MTTGSRIRALRESRGMTQRQLAERAGCTDAAIRNYEAGRRALKAPKLAAAIKAWESQVDALDRGEITPEEYESWKMGIGGC